MHINYYRDLPLAFGVVAILIGIVRGGRAFSPCSTPDGENPQWYCRAVLNFVGTILIFFGILGNFAPK